MIMKVKSSFYFFVSFSAADSTTSWTMFPMILFFLLFSSKSCSIFTVLFILTLQYCFMDLSCYFISMFGNTPFPELSKNWKFEIPQIFFFFRCVGFKYLSELWKFELKLIYSSSTNVLKPLFSVKTLSRYHTPPRFHENLFFQSFIVA